MVATQRSQYIAEQTWLMIIFKAHNMFQNWCSSYSGTDMVGIVVLRLITC